MQYNHVAYKSSLLVSPPPFGAYCYRENIHKTPILKASTRFSTNQKLDQFVQYINQFITQHEKFDLSACLSFFYIMSATENVFKQGLFKRAY